MVALHFAYLYKHLPRLAKTKSTVHTNFVYVKFVQMFAPIRHIKCNCWTSIVKSVNNELGDTKWKWQWRSVKCIDGLVMRRCRYRSNKVTLRSSCQECVCKARYKFALWQNWHCKCTIWYDTPERVASAPDITIRRTTVLYVTNSSENSSPLLFLYFSLFYMYVLYFPLFVFNCS